MNYYQRNNKIDHLGDLEQKFYRSESQEGSGDLGIYTFDTGSSHGRQMTAQEKKERDAAKSKSVNYSGYRRALQKIYDPVFNVGIDSYDVLYKITTYSLRRTSATKVYKAQGIIAAQKFLNHTDIKTTMKYLNISDEEVDNAVDIL